VGRLDPIKGLDLLLESVARLRREARLIVVGGDPAGDPEVERLRARATELGIARRVAFPGAVPQEELPRYYQAADAVVVTSRYESFGLVAVEALACGTPVVAAQVGGLPSILQDGMNGLLVRWRSPQAFAERLDELLGDEALRARLAAHARPSVERFDWRRIGDEVRLIYYHLTAAGRCAEACSCF
jgi:D-inositol-3-phosphate glycosyltransferase